MAGGFGCARASLFYYPNSRAISFYLWYEFSKRAILLVSWPASERRYLLPLISV